MHLVNRLNKFGADCLIVFVCKLDNLILAALVPVKTIFKSERVGNMKLFPSDHSSSANFVRLDFEAAIANIEHVRFLSKDTWQQTDYSPAKKAPICCSVAPIEKGILFL